MKHLALSGEVETAFYVPDETSISDRMSKLLFTGMPLYEIHDNLRVYAPIVHDIIDVSDKKKMTYSKVYVVDEEQFGLREAYEISGGVEQNLNRGRMDSLTISTTNFESLTSLVIHPFVTEQFINGYLLPVKKLVITDYMEIENETVVLKDSMTVVIEGESQMIDRGSLAAYNLGLPEYETLTELEVQSG